MSTTALAGTNNAGYPGLIYNSRPNLNVSDLIRRCGCDLPEDGGITGNLGKDDKPIPGACEERPKMIDPKTGEIVYVDVYYKEHRLPGASFSTTA